MINIAIFIQQIFVVSPDEECFFYNGQPILNPAIQGYHQTAILFVLQTL